MSKHTLTRRKFIRNSATLLAGGAVLAGLRPAKLFAATNTFEPDPYCDKTVIRIFDPSVTSFMFETSDKNFYYRTFDINKIQSMLATGLLRLTGAETVVAAWRKIMPDVSAKSKIAVKVNLNCSHDADGWSTGADVRKNIWTSSPNSTPYMMAALARSLEKAGIAQANITFFDCSRTFESQWKTDLQAQCPNVLALGRRDGIGDSDFSVSFTNGTGSIPIPAPLMDANYLINLHLFKKHYSGATGALKNLLGLTGNAGAIAHTGKGAKQEFNSGTNLRDLSMNAEVRKRAVLCISEAILGDRLPTENINPLRNMSFFPNGKSSSLFMSRSPFFHDLVQYNFMNCEINNDPNAQFETLGWLTNCIGAVPSFTSEVIGSASIINNPISSQLPPKDLSYPLAKLKFISTTPS